jgi:hypothetical protein
MMTLPWDKHPLIEMIYPMYDSVVQVLKQSTLHQIFTPRELHIPQKVSPPTVATRQDDAWYKALYPRLAATDRRPV